MCLKVFCLCGCGRNCEKSPTMNGFASAHRQLPDEIVPTWVVVYSRLRILSTVGIVFFPSLVRKHSHDDRDARGALLAAGLSNPPGRKPSTFTFYGG